MKALWSKEKIESSHRSSMIQNPSGLVESMIYNHKFTRRGEDDSFPSKIIFKIVILLWLLWYLQIKPKKKFKIKEGHWDAKVILLITLAGVCDQAPSSVLMKSSRGLPISFLVKWSTKFWWILSLHSRQNKTRNYQMRSGVSSISSMKGSSKKICLLHEYH